MRTLTASRTAAPPAIDGALDDIAWKHGAVADTFWVSDRQGPPVDQTRVVVLYDDHALYFAFTCFDRRPDLIRATQVTRNAAPGFDDRVMVELDPYHNHRSLSRFSVTARGTQFDDIDEVRHAGKKGVWTAAARRTAYGWTAEIAIPLDLLEFDPESHTFGVNFSRYQHRTREWSEWANVTAQRLPDEAGHLTGLALPRSVARDRLAVAQYVSVAASTKESGTGLTTGGDARYRWGSALTSVVYTRPDFSDTDTDVADLRFSYNEKYLRDRRTFFQEGASFFGNREIFHSGRIERFDVGVKTFGRIDHYQVGVLATADADSDRADYVARIVREVGPAFNMGATVAGSDGRTLGNNTLQLQAGGRIGSHVRVDGNVARSATTGAGEGVRRRGEIAYKTSRWQSGAWVDHTDPEYLPANGFIASDLMGTTGRGGYIGFNKPFARAGVRRADATVSYDVRDTTSGLRQRETASFYAGAEMTSNVKVNAGMTAGSYRPRGAGPGEWLDVVNDDRFYTASAYYTSPTGQFGYGSQYSWGYVGRMDYDSFVPSAWVAPTSDVSFSYTFERAHRDDVQHQHVVSGRWEISRAQSLSARWVEYDGGYYRVSYHRALAEGLDAFGVYSSDPYDAAKFNVKLIWSFLPLSRQ